MEIVVATVGDLCYLCLYLLNYDETSLVILYNSLPHRDALYRLKIVNRADPDQAALLRQVDLTSNFFVLRATRTADATDPYKL